MMQRTLPRPGFLSEFRPAFQLPMLGFALCLSLAACDFPLACAQTHVVRKADQVVRAVAVYEWTGEEGAPTASRVVPVSLFIDGQYQDAAIYMARPVPMALETGTVYQVLKVGLDAGTLELMYERHLTSGDTAEIDDGWLGYGEFKVKPRETLLAKKQSGPLPRLVVGSATGSESGGPKLTSRSGAVAGSDSNAGNKGSGTTASDPAVPNDEDSDSPTLHRRAASSSAQVPPDTPSPNSGNSKSDSASQSGSKTAPSPGTASDDDAERPTLKRRTPAQIKAGQKQKDAARVVAGSELNDDPDRPTLHRGSKTRTQEEEVPPLRGLPRDMKQLVAVSDAKDRPEHDFTRRWQSEEEHADVMRQMQVLARAQLSANQQAPNQPATARQSASANAASTAPRSATARAAARRKAAAAAAASPSVPLNEESLAGYTLSYGGASTYVYSATSPGANGLSRYVSVVAQEEPAVGLKLALASVTDSSHLDRTPWMRFLDVVDADASNRASLLVELRAQHTRQFALYRVIGAHADQVFLTGSTE